MIMFKQCNRHLELEAIKALTKIRKMVLLLHLLPERVWVEEVWVECKEMLIRHSEKVHCSIAFIHKEEWVLKMENIQEDHQ